MSQGFRTLNLVKLINCVARLMDDGDKVALITIVRIELTCVYYGIVDIDDRMAAYPIANKLFSSKVEYHSADTYPLMDEPTLIRRLDKIEGQLLRYLRYDRDKPADIKWSIDGTLIYT